ncbi:hypothetical protein IX307_001178 [Bacteroides pyogenes]|nr:hypothetical protein [Bacteroides pyogenes]MBR8786864.1 hypothetical protein [Bacteroides pyogenes]MBR8792349.1 hypothetical protein [Bacteroides pyogenes]
MSIESCKRIHQSKIWEMMERRQDGRPIEFSIEYCKKSTGELIRYERAVLTSFHSSGSTINVLPAGESTPRKIRRCLITRFNNIKVYF